MNMKPTPGRVTIRSNPGQAGRNTMQLNCKLNQCEAIRRGYNASSSIKLEVDPSSLTQLERDTLADHFNAGDYNPNLAAALLNEPTLEGLKESLACIANDKAQKADALERKKAELQERFDACKQDMVTVNRHGNVYLSGSNSNIEYLRDDQRQELAQIVSKSMQQYQLEDATKQLVAQQRLDDQEKQLEEFRQWALNYGSETLRLRVEEGFKWQPLAEKEWAYYMLAKSGIQDTPLEGMPEYTASIGECPQPSAQEIKLLRHFRSALDTIPEAAASAELVCCTYSKIESDGEFIDEETDCIVRNEIKVTIRGHARGEVFYYSAS